MLETDVGASSETAPTEIDLEILRLKRELASEDFQGHSCEKCKDLRIRSPLTPEVHRDDGPNFFHIDTTGKEIHDDFATSGCMFWVMIRDQLAYVNLDAELAQERESGTRQLRRRGVTWFYAEDSNRDVEYAVNRPDFVRVSMVHNDDGGAGSRYITVKVEMVAPRKPIETLRNPSRGDEIRLDACWSTFLALALPGDLEDTQRCTSAPINLAPASPTSMKLISQWIKKCDIEHMCGIGDPPSSMPTMLLDVSNADKVKLIEVPATMRDRYITLSYCWGAARQTVMLNEESKAALVAGISPQEFDRTIRDSITVVRELGYRFLWVDALCIPQDDETPKARELSIMNDIYRNATFTIVASVANDVRDGFLDRRRPTIDGATPLPDGQSPYVFKTATPVVLLPHSPDELELWYTRAWTLQELLFSGRRLQFRARQTTWVCNCAQTMTQEWDGWIGDKTGGYYDPHDDKGDFYNSIMALLRRHHGSPPPAPTTLADWYTLVEQFSSRRLTYATDRLPAISGIAKEFASLLGDEYVCGLWKSDLAYGLLWSAMPNKLLQSVGTKSMPSWSWASTPGTVEWTRDFPLMWQNEDFEVSGCDVDLAMPNAAFGQVKAARLYVRGLVKPLVVPEEHRRKKEFSICLEGQLYVTVYLDSKENPWLLSGSECRLALLLVMNNHFKASGILLGEEGENGYSRLGRFRVKDIWRGVKDTPRHGWMQSLKRKSLSRKPERCRVRMQSLWGGEENIRSIVLV
ncbi:hypothetical protein PG996_011182 [Apiospora saccharicola]|uniref:Heterokaryon incompatibility domain-containing protein n=1 Tax=Apiospora saccharicola TaxID=335842 RepID=A0ABR1UGN5_9PEZI